MVYGYFGGPSTWYMNHDGHYFGYCGGPSTRNCGPGSGVCSLRAPWEALDSTVGSAVMGGTPRVHVRGLKWEPQSREPLEYSM